MILNFVCKLHFYIFKLHLFQTRLQITKISQHEQFQKIAGRIIREFQQEFTTDLPKIYQPFTNDLPKIYQK